MILIEKAETASCTNPVLVFVAATAGILTDLNSLEFEIWDTSSDALRDTPTIVGARTVVSLADCPGGSRAGLGRYAVTFDATTATNTGRHEVRWFWTLTATSAEQSSVEAFDVVDRRLFTNQPLYVLPSTLRDEGYAADFVSDSRLQQAIAIASAFVERITGQYFEARDTTRTVDGSGARAVLLGEPIVAVESVTVEGTTIDLPSLKIYNRHLSERMTTPDDRANPRIEFQNSDYYDSADYQGVRSQWIERFPRNAQNVQITGLFGYTEWDGSPTGKTPEMLSHLVKLIVAREIPELSNSDCRAEVQDGWRVIELKTRDQMIKYEVPRKWGEFTGDPTIDMLLVSFMRPIQIGGV